MIRICIVIIISFSILSGCTLDAPDTSPQSDATINAIRATRDTGAALTESMIPTNTPYPDALWFMALDVMRGICFESAYDARDQIFIMRNKEELNTFFDLADNSQLCSRPVKRGAFDFSHGHVLAGFWSYGIGCTAGHEVVSTEKDDQARTLKLYLRFFIEGDCPYELVRPFWVGLSGVSNYDIQLLPAQP